MDFYIKLALVVAWAGFSVVLLVWWRRRHSSRRYPYSDRAAVILRALEQRADLGMIYWSKSERRHLRRVVTPQSLDGYAMRAFDPKVGDVRIFKVTRIRLIELIPPGAPKRAPSRWKLVTPALAVAVLAGCFALGLLGLVLLRGKGPERLTGIVPPPVEPPADLSVAVAAARAPALMPTNQLAERTPVEALAATQPAVRVTGMAPVTGTDTDDFLNAPMPVVPKASSQWRVVVLKHASYQVNQVATALAGTIRCSNLRCVELEQAVRNIGEAVVWSGKRERAEKLKQLLEGYDLAVRLDPPEEEPAAANPPAH